MVFLTHNIAKFFRSYVLHVYSIKALIFGRIIFLVSLCCEAPASVPGLHFCISAGSEYIYLILKELFTLYFGEKIPRASFSCAVVTDGQISPLNSLFHLTKYHTKKHCFVGTISNNVIAKNTRSMKKLGMRRSRVARELYI